MSSIKTMLPEECLILRDGTKQHLQGADIVPGDILYIKMGDKLPADVRFIEASPDARFDRSILTGETVPLRGTVDSVSPTSLFQCQDFADDGRLMKTSSKLLA